MDVDELVRKYCLKNAIEYEGKANPKAVLGKVIGENPDLRKDVPAIMAKVQAFVKDINALSLEQQKQELEGLAPELLEKKKQVKEAVLPELPDAEGGVVMRFAPSPSGPLHIGHTRAAILNDEYVRRYGGKMYLRLEDTNPNNIDMAAYDLIPQDLEWLGAEVSDIIIQSDRMQHYYDTGKALLKGEHAYICTCDVEDWRKLKESGKPCPHRSQPANEALDLWERMHSGHFQEGQASMVVKTDLNDPNPALRDFVGFRIVDAVHPRVGDKYSVYPLYNLSVAVDDHLLGMTHILRGKDHLNNTFRQKYVYNYLGWKMPHFNHYGWVSIEGTILKTSTMAQGIRDGQFTGWDDVRLGTLQALAKRGFSPDALRRYWLEVGINEVDIKFSWQTFFAFNKEIIDPTADRQFFVPEPVSMPIIGVKELASKAPLRPNDPDAGYREEILAAPITVLLPKEEFDPIQDGQKLRLKDLANVTKTKDGLEYLGNDLAILKEGVPILQWVCESTALDMIVQMPDGTDITGLAEPGVKERKGRVIQFERFGFIRLDEKEDGVAYFLHK